MRKAPQAMMTIQMINHGDGSLSPVAWSYAESTICFVW
jgi:hypothetical protein